MERGVKRGLALMADENMLHLDLKRERGTTLVTVENLGQMKAPYWYLSYDILVMIFELAYTTPRPRIATLSRVCKRWRSVIIRSTLCLPTLSDPSILRSAISSLSFATALRVVGPLPHALPKALRKLQMEHRESFEHNCGHFTALRSLTSLDVPLLMGCSCPLLLITRNRSTLTRLSLTLQRQHGVIDWEYRRTMRPLHAVRLPRLQSLELHFDTNLVNDFFWNILMGNLITHHAFQLHTLRLNGEAERYPRFILSQLTNLTELRIELLEVAAVHAFPLAELPSTISLRLQLRAWSLLPYALPSCCTELLGVEPLESMLSDTKYSRLSSICIKLTDGGKWPYSTAVLASYARLTQLCVLCQPSATEIDVAPLEHFTRLAKLQLACNWRALSSICSSLPRLTSLKLVLLKHLEGVDNIDQVFATLCRLVGSFPHLRVLSLALSHLRIDHNATSVALVERLIWEVEKRTRVDRVALHIPPHAIRLYRPVAVTLERVEVALISELEAM